MGHKSKTEKAKVLMADIVNYQWLPNKTLKLSNILKLQSPYKQR